MDGAPVNPEWLRILQHSLGLDQYGLNKAGEPVGYRNRFVIDCEQ